ncbi:WD40-repeat-containing domain protein [Rhypophila decipiens]|uniref:WD40-repeat-containing domain protein n=1 Tax=Rhypophila decipiens TaxID=261697 RepID=A0AAN6YCZ5_9PEZI|nr:WD40-repeat-containing domain protein [Rhypophila decipiens]
MSSSRPQNNNNPAADEVDPVADHDLDELAEDDAAEILEDAQVDSDGDVAMDSDDDDQQETEEIHLQNDSIAYFDSHKHSIFAIAQHPIHTHLIATGGSEGEDDDAPGKGYVFDTSIAVSHQPLLPASYASDPASSSARENTELKPLFAIDGHTDSINALTFTLPKGDFLVTGGMDGLVKVYMVGVPKGGDSSQARLKFLAESRETEEINWLIPCPSPEYPNTLALGASDGSVWVLTVDIKDRASPIRIVQSYFLHTGPCTSGAWSPDGNLLATVSEDSSLHVFDVWGVAGAKGLVTENGQTVVSLTSVDQRFAVEGGLYSVAIAPSGTFLAVGGAQGAIRIVGLPRLGGQSAPAAQIAGAGARRGAAAEVSTQAGQILAALNVQSDGIETLSFAPAPQNLLAAGSVDGSIAVFDTARSFAVRKHIREAHEGAVVKVDFVKNAPQPGMTGWLLTSCGVDGVVRRWDLRGATASQNVTGTGLVKEWRGHQGGGEEGGGIFGFVQGETGERVVTAGDDALALVFEA